MMTLACSPVDCQLSDSVSEGTDNTDTTGYSSDEEMDRTSAVKRSIGSTTGCTITKKAPTRTFSWLKAATTAFTFNSFLPRIDIENR